MRTIRARLAVGYAMAMGGTLTAFGLALLLANRAASFEDVDERITAEAELAASLIAETRLGEQVTTVEDPRTKQIRRVASVSTLLDLVPDMLVVVNPAGEVVYASPEAQDLGSNVTNALRNFALPEMDQQRLGSASIRALRRDVRYVVRPITTDDALGDAALGAVVVAATPNPTFLTTTQLIASMLAIAPLVILASVLLGYWLAGRALKPIEAITNELQAITDGTSLHKRLAPPAILDEPGRLALTLNAMLTRLEQSFAALRRFTADASHEIKTPLTIIRGGVERALTTRGVPGDTLELLEETLVELNRMTEMLDALLTLARADEGRAPLHLEPVDLRDQIAEAFETAEMLAEPTGVTIDAQLPAAPVVVSADRSRVRQLLMNLLTNAVKYTPPGGRVTLSLEARNGDAVMAVTDTGLGIAPGDLPRIFDRFWRAETARARTGRSGVGLGLAICKWIAEAHGGTIEARSRAARGSTFTVTLPLADRQET
jgi:heavy metal sensor kinase